MINQLAFSSLFLLSILVSFGTSFAAPAIELSPVALNFEMAAGETAWSSFSIRNAGDSPLNFQLGIPSLIIFPQPGWISVQPSQGSVPAGGEQGIGVRFDSRQLNPAWPVGTVVVVSSNDPDEPEIGYVVTLNLLPYQPIPAVLEVRPDKLNAARGGPWITAWIELPAGFDPGTIVVPSLRLGGVPPADPEHSSIRDQNHNGIEELSVRFDRDVVLSNLTTGNAVELTVTGDLEGGRPFNGRTTVEITSP